MKVSIIIPCYNVESYIADCIESVKNQDYGDLELICVDDGSTDGTGAKLNRLVSGSSLDVTLLEQSNLGASSARNHGLRHAKGKYIQFLDADDVLEPQKINRQVALAIENGEPDIVVGSFMRKRMSGETVFSRRYDGDGPLDLWLPLMKTDLGITSANLFKASNFHEGIQWNEALQSSQEYELMFQILKKSKHVIFDSEILTHIRTRPSGSITQTNIDAKWDRYVQLRADILDHICHVECDSLRPEHLQAFFDCIRLLYPHNPHKAKYFYKAYIPAGFVPQVSKATGKLYIMTYQLLGFVWAERIRSLFSSHKAG